MVQILGVTFYDGPMTSLIDDTIAATMPGKGFENLCISASGAHGVIEANDDPVFKNVLDNFYINIPDGMPIVWVGRIKGARKMERCYGPHFFRDTISRSATAGTKHFFCGGKEGIALELKTYCENELNNQSVVGVFSPPFRQMSDDEMKELGDMISASGADIVWIGLGSPKQEKFAMRLASFTKVHFIVTVGAAFDFYTGHLKQAPVWMQKIGMEWFFRLVMEPRRLYKRYFYIVPKFIYLNFRELLRYMLRRK